jgi:hypothetical protein
MLGKKTARCTCDALLKRIYATDWDRRLAVEAESLSMASPKRRS